MDVNAAHWQPQGVCFALNLVKDDAPEVCQVQSGQEKPASLFKKMTFSMPGDTLLKGSSSHHQDQLRELFILEHQRITRPGPVFKQHRELPEILGMLQ